MAYRYEIHVDVSWAFPNRAGGFDYLPVGDYMTVIQSERRLSNTFLCNAAMNTILRDAQNTIVGSAGLARSGARPYLGDCTVLRFSD